MERKLPRGLLQHVVLLSHCLGHFCSENERQVPEKPNCHPAPCWASSSHFTNSRSDQKHWPQRGHLPGPGPTFLHPHLIWRCRTRATTQATIFQGVLLLKQGPSRSNPLLNHSSPLIIKTQRIKSPPGLHHTNFPKTVFTALPLSFHSAHPSQRHPPAACRGPLWGRGGRQEETSLQELRSTWLISVLMGGVPDFYALPLSWWLTTEKRGKREMQIRETYLMMDGLIRGLP